MTSTPEAYELFAVKYRRHKRNASANFIGGDPHDGPMPLDDFVWLARGAKRSFVIDTGFTAEASVLRKRQMLRRPAEALRPLGVDAAAVEDLILTHLHYDHAGNFGLFSQGGFPPSGQGNGIRDRPQNRAPECN
jgi:glyoxylase-like metal-dependent hydrolase (beta-lactamase superfamily II)